VAHNDDNGNRLWGPNGPGFSSASDDWQTPPAVFASLNAEFDFSIDVCASDANHKCAAYFTAADDGLTSTGGVASGAIRPTAATAAESPLG
jgi:phage N-6-adenine-methyltransferase